MKFRPFNSKKVTQAAAQFLKLRKKSMSYMKLIKLLYLADRAAILRFGHPISGDKYVSMRHGPVLSYTCNLINEQPRPGEEANIDFWHKCISPPTNYEVSLYHDAGTEELSESEIEIINEVFSKYGPMDRWQIRDFTHSLPEWKDPGDSSLPLPIEDILLGENFPAEQVKIIIDELDSLAAEDRLFMQ